MNDTNTNLMTDVNDDVDATIEASINFQELVESNNWQEPGKYYQTMPATTRKAVNKVVEADQKMRKELREIYLPKLLQAGTINCWNKADQALIEAIQQKRLYSGKVVAADGTIARYETLSLVGAQIAISKVSYQGSTGQIAFNLMYMGKEVPRQTTANDIAEAIRSRGTKLTNKIPNLFLYSLMLYKERQLLLESPKDTFKLIHGPIFPHELLSGSGQQHTLKICLELIEALINDGSYACIVSRDTHGELLAMGMALDAGEYFVLSNSGVDALNEFFDENNPTGTAHYTRTSIPEYGGLSQIDLFKNFRNAYGPKVVRGVMRAHRMSPPFVFYCNVDRVDEAVHTLMADATNTGARGFPLLIDMADQYCSGAFKASEYTNHMNAEFIRASGGSGMYQSERTTRD